MSRLIQFVERGDPCHLFFVVLVLVVIGAYLANPNQQRWGGMLAAVAFLGFGAYRYLTASPARSNDLLAITISSLTVAGFVLGVSWITLPLLASVWQAVGSALWGTPARWIASAKRKAAERRRKRDEEEEHRQWDRSRSQADRQSEQTRRDAEARMQQEATAQRRRDKARAGCELFYLSNPDLESAMPRDKLEQFVSRYMGDNQPPEVVEENAAQLRQIMERFVEKGSGTLQGVSIADRAKNLEEEIRQIQASNLSDREKETLVSMLKRQFMAGLQKEIEP